MLRIFKRSVLINEKDLKMFEWYYQTYHLSARDLLCIGANEVVNIRVFIKQLRTFYRENCKDVVL